MRPRRQAAAERVKAGISHAPSLGAPATALSSVSLHASVINFPSVAVTQPVPPGPTHEVAEAPRPARSPRRGHPTPSTPRSQSRKPRRDTTGRPEHGSEMVFSGASGEPTGKQASPCLPHASDGVQRLRAPRGPAPPAGWRPCPALAPPPRLALGLPGAGPRLPPALSSRTSPTAAFASPQLRPARHPVQQVGP